MLKRVLRSAQTFAPQLRPLKFAAYNFGTRRFGLRIDQEFKLLKVMAPTGLALDIGGNWGQSIYALKRTARPSLVKSFEPNPILARHLEQTFATDPQVEIIGTALGDQAGHFDLFIPRYRSFVYDGLASLNEGEAKSWLNARTMARFDEHKLKIDSYPVAVTRLDDLNLEPEVVKIDVQGAELLVVRGGLQTFDAAKPVSIVEEPNAELIDLFASIGLAAYGLEGNRLAAWRQQSKNAVFISDASKARFGL